MKKKILGLGLVVAVGAGVWAFEHRPAVSQQRPNLDPREILGHKMADLPEIPDTQRMCDAVGGVWGKIGLSPKEQCNIKTSDGGNGCIDSKACESLCIANLSEEQLMKLKQDKKSIEIRGECARWRIVVGCQPVVVEGAVWGLVCID